MVITLITGVLVSLAILGLAWLLFMQLRKFKAFDFLNSREANRQMLLGSIGFYFISIFIIIYFMLNNA